MVAERKMVRVAAVGDIRCSKISQGALRPLYLLVLRQAFLDRPSFRVLHIPAGPEHA